MRVSAGWKLSPTIWLSMVGVLLLSPIKYENLWMWYYLAYLRILVKFPTAFFCDCQLNLNLLIFLCKEMSDTSWRVAFQGASSPKGHILCVLRRGEMEWDGTIQNRTQACFSVVSKEIFKFVLNLCATFLCRQLDPWQGLSVLFHFKSLGNFTWWLSGFVPF